LGEPVVRRVGVAGVDGLPAGDDDVLRRAVTGPVVGVGPSSVEPPTGQVFRRRGQPVQAVVGVVGARPVRCPLSHSVATGLHHGADPGAGGVSVAQIGEHRARAGTISAGSGGGDAQGTPRGVHRGVLHSPTGVGGGDAGPVGVVPEAGAVHPGVGGAVPARFARADQLVAGVVAVGHGTLPVGEARQQPDRADPDPSRSRSVTGTGSAARPVDDPFGSPRPVRGRHWLSPTDR